VAYFADSLYKSDNIEAALKQVFGAKSSIIDISNATATGTRIGIPVATVNGKPSRRLFTNYNGVGNRSAEHGSMLFFFVVLIFTDTSF
jgi:hypothetical protein